MSLATLTSRELSRVQKLIERKEALARQIDEINSELQAIESGGERAAARALPAAGTAATPAAGNRGQPPMPARKAGRPQKTVRGGLKDRITRELKAAGKQGMKVGDLATKLGTSYGNVTAFFQSTGKKIKEIEKVGPAQFAWTGA